jgi:hypothetical protein
MRDQQPTRQAKLNGMARVARCSEGDLGLEGQDIVKQMPAQRGAPLHLGLQGRCSDP